MDHAGAVIGPLIAAAALASGVPLASVFVWSVVPGLALLILLGIGLPRAAPVERIEIPALRWRIIDTRSRRLILGVGALAFFTVPEVLAILLVSERGLAVHWIPLVWAGASLLKMSIAWPAGLAADRYGRLPVLAGGWLARIAVFVSFALAEPGEWWAGVLFCAYAMALAATEAAERSLIADRAPDAIRGTAFGFYHLATGLAVLPGALLFGWLWQAHGVAVAWLIAAGGTSLAALYVWRAFRATDPQYAA
jgi:MFS family permease